MINRIGFDRFVSCSFTVLCTYRYTVVSGAVYIERGLAGEQPLSILAARGAGAAGLHYCILHIQIPLISFHFAFYCSIFRAQTILLTR